LKAPVRAGAFFCAQIAIFHDRREGEWRAIRRLPDMIESDSMNRILHYLITEWVVMENLYYNHVSHNHLLITTRAVRHFVKEHEGTQIPILDQILASLESADFAKASKLFKTINFGPYGFSDWFPPTKFPNEDPEYVQVVWESLVERWHRLMTTAAGEQT
jgi:hypothetical protein